jgi:hypothetical protein
MSIALIDNGSLEPAAHRNLRRVAAELSVQTGVTVQAVSWKHSDRIRAEILDGQPAWTLAPWLKAQFAAGEREFIFVPFFISPQGAIGSWLRRELEQLQAELGDFRFTFTASLVSQGVLAKIVVARIRETLARLALRQPPVVLVDHGGPSPASAAVRDQVAAEVRQQLGGEIGRLIATSMEGAEHRHNQPIFEDVLRTTEFGGGHVIVAPLFLTPGRHAGPRGDLATIATSAADRLAQIALHCHFTELVGTHPDVVPALADALNRTLSTTTAAA